MRFMEAHLLIRFKIILNPVEYSPFLEPLKKAANLKYKEYIRETILENQRRGYMLRIYPARGSDMYDPFF